jgi:hypothetical protein
VDVADGVEHQARDATAGCAPRPASCTHAASMSAPRGRRTVTVKPSRTRSPAKRVRTLRTAVDTTVGARSSESG